MISITFTLNTDRARRVLNEARSKIAVALSRKLTALMLKLQQHIVVDKLQGQVLRHRSGTLAGSIQAQPAELVGALITARVTGATGPAWYGKVHELGGPTGEGTTIVPVNKKVLSFMIGDKRVFAKSVFVPRRPFMAPSLEEMRPQILAELQATIEEAIQ